jgi:ParB-like chromosome segregation protein Spo0J
MSHEEIDKKVMDQKLSESRSSGLYDSIKANGVSKPVYVSNNKKFGQTVGDGHHRIAAAHNINPNMLIPVEHG